MFKKKNTFNPLIAFPFFNLLLAHSSVIYRLNDHPKSSCEPRLSKTHRQNGIAQLSFTVCCMDHIMSAVLCSPEDQPMLEMEHSAHRTAAWNTPGINVIPLSFFIIRGVVVGHFL